jgi:hypothetical protein
MNPLLLLALGVALQPGPAAPNGALVRKAVMMPARVGGTPSQEDTASLRGVERALAEALARHGNLHILTQTEIAALLSQEQQSQLLGCEAESCMAEIADALGAEVTVLTQVDVTPGLWSLRCALVDRRSALTLRRAAVKARDLDGLLQSVDVVARQLGSGVLHTLEDPRLAARLGTSDAGLTQLRAQAAAADEDVTTRWTELLIQRNRESSALALAQGGLWIAAGLLAVLGGATAAMAYSYFTVATPPAKQDVLTVGLGYGYGQPLTDTGGRLRFPWAAAVVAMLAPVPLWLAAVGTGVAALVLGVVDRLNLGRIPVQRSGCCRDEEKIKAATAPTLAQRLAPVAAALGGGVALLGVVSFAACGNPVTQVAALVVPLAVARGLRLLLAPAGVAVPPFPTSTLGPRVSVTPDSYSLAHALLVAGFLLSVPAVVVPLAALTFLHAILLIRHERSDILDAEAAPASAAR